MKYTGEKKKEKTKKKQIEKLIKDKENKKKHITI